MVGKYEEEKISLGERRGGRRKNKKRKEMIGELIVDQVEQKSAMIAQLHREAVEMKAKAEKDLAEAKEIQADLLRREEEVKNGIFLFCFVLFCFVLFCFVLFCFVLFCFVLFCFVLFCFVLFCFVL